MTKTAYRTNIERVADEHRLEANLVEAVVIIESSGQTDAFRFEPDFYRRYLANDPRYVGQIARRIASSYGLMQVMFTTALEHDFPYQDPEYLFVPAIGLEYGCRHLEMLLAWADGDVLKALAAYNGGKGNWKGERPQAYCRKVNAKLEAIQQVRLV